MVYASPAILNSQVEQAQIPELLLRNLVEPQEGHLLVFFRLLMIRPYLFLTVDPYFAPSPFMLPCSLDLDIGSSLF